jgi:hypothetical protein
MNLYLKMPMDLTKELLKDIPDHELINELMERGNLVDMWTPTDIEHIDHNYRIDNDAKKMDVLNENDYTEILALAQEELDNNVGINWSILEGYYLEFLQTNNLI